MTTMTTCFALFCYIYISTFYLFIYTIILLLSRHSRHKKYKELKMSNLSYDDFKNKSSLV